MSNSTERRQEIYDKIKASSKQEYIISEMKRLGFLSEDNVDLKRAEAYFKEEKRLSTELQKLLKKAQQLENPQAFLNAKHKERKQRSKEQQKLKKEERERLRQEKAERWTQSKKADIIYLGEGYSHELNHKTSNVERLQSNQLPVFQSVKDLASAMHISVNELRFLAFSRKHSKINHYKRFKVAKKSGGYRLISAPMPKLKKAQHFILEHILNQVETHPKAHGCVKRKSIVTNAELHVNKAVVINQDLQNFFPSVTYKRIKGVFKSLGYSEQLSVIFSLICSEPKILDVELLGENYFSQQGERFLPQGSPCSPAITNILCKKLDYRLNGLAKKYGFEYSRYVDDITFSGNEDQLQHITSVLKYSKRIIKDENFTLHPDKLRVMKRSQRQEVTGIVVNEKPNINKKNLKRFRALLHQIERDGIEGKSWNGRANVLDEINGYAHFIYQVDKEKGKIYKDRVEKILDRHNYKVKKSSKTTIIKSVSASKEKKSFFQKVLSFFKL